MPKSKPTPTTEGECRHTDWGYDAIGGFPGHEHEHPTGEIKCFDCGIRLSKLLARTATEAREKVIEEAIEAVGGETALIDTGGMTYETKRRLVGFNDALLMMNDRLTSIRQRLEKLKGGRDEHY